MNYVIPYHILLRKLPTNEYSVLFLLGSHKAAVSKPST